MKKTLVLFAALIATAGAAAWVYNQALISNPALAVNQNYPLNLKTTPNAAGIQSLSAQAVYSSSTFSAASFTDGRLSTGSVTVTQNSSLIALNATNQITVAPTATILAASATNYLVVLTTASLSNAVITYNGNAVRQGHEWTVVSTTSGTAAGITTALNKYAGLTAQRTNSTVALSYAAGAGGNSKTLSVNVSSITAGGALFGGGHNNRIAGAYLTLNGLKYPQGSGWQAQSTSSGTATNLAAWLNRQSGIRASASASVVYATATAVGVAGNSFSLASSAPSYLTVANATFSGGLDNARVIINGVVLKQGTNWTAADTSSGTAKAISNAIMASASLNTIIRSTWTMITVSSIGVVSATSTATGASVNYTLATNAANSLTLSNPTMTGGSAGAWATNTSVINLPSHGFGTGLGVTFSTSTGVGIAPLNANNTAVYYVAKIDANNVAISTTSAGAVAGNYIVLGAALTTGPHTFTLTPQVISGTATLTWQVSNDCVNYTTLTTAAALNFQSPWTAGQTAWNFGRVNYACIRAAEVAPSAGAWNLTVTVMGN